MTRVSPALLKSGCVYETRMGAGGRVLIVSVGPKWITFRDWVMPYGTSVPRWGRVRKLRREGWNGPFFEEVT
jgi:hypothetical protein